MHLRFANVACAVLLPGLRVNVAAISEPLLWSSKVNSPARWLSDSVHRIWRAGIVPGHISSRGGVQPSAQFKKAARHNIRPWLA